MCWLLETQPETAAVQKTASNIKTTLHHMYEFCSFVSLLVLVLNVASHSISFSLWLWLSSITLLFTLWTFITYLDRQMHAEQLIMFFWHIVALYWMCCWGEAKYECMHSIVTHQSTVTQTIFQLLPSQIREQQSVMWTATLKTYILTMLMPIHTFATFSGAQ